MSSGGKPVENKHQNGSHSSAARKHVAAREKEPALRCPRCDSPNTKFCYYNNYSLSQPRHFCKTCRRYWTKGGALRNVPIGGGCRKSKKLKCSPRDTAADVGGLRVFPGISPAMDFQINFQPRLNPAAPGLCNQFSSVGDQGSYNFDPYCGGASSSTLMGLGFPLSSGYKPGEGANTTGFQEMGAQPNLEPPIESLSCINQDLQWKIQQQRLSSFHQQPLSPLLFQNLEISNAKQAHRKDNGGTGNLATEWFFGNSYSAVAPSSTGNITNWSSFP